MTYESMRKGCEIADGIREVEKSIGIIERDDVLVAIKSVRSGFDEVCINTEWFVDGEKFKDNLLAFFSGELDRLKKEFEEL